MKMDLGGAAESSTNSSDQQRSLESIFQHPEGLQTARDLVQVVATQWFTQTARSETSGLSGTNVDVEKLLQDILAFNDAYDPEVPPRPAMMDSTLDGIPMAVDGLAAEQAHPERSTGAQGVRQSTHATQPPESKSAPLETHSTSTASSTSRSMTDHSPEIEIQSIFAAKTMHSSILQGTESPYRVESPAAQVTTISSSQSLTQMRKENSRDKHLALPSNSDLSRARFSISDRDGNPAFTNPLGEGASSLRMLDEQRGPSNSRACGFTPMPAQPASTSSHPRRPFSTIPSTEPSSVLAESSTIKSFMPVNKIGASMHQIPYRSEPARSINANPHTSFKSERSLDPFTALQSPSPPPSFATPQLGGSPTVNELSSPGLTDTESDTDDINMSSRKRKPELDGAMLLAKRLKKAQGLAKPTKKVGKRAGKSRDTKSEQAREKLPQAIWMRILEFTPPNFLTKARLINKSFKAMVDQFDSIFINCRKENFGWDMPPPPMGLTERQYSDLFGGKGCLEPGCTDELSSRTHWSWAKRWCQDCWKGKIEREDRAIKKYQNQYGRLTLTKLLECIPVGVHDSFMKPHDYIDNIESRERQAPRLYKYYLSEDVERVIKEYEELTPAPFVEDPSHTAEQKATARADHQKLMDALEDKRNEFFETRKKATDEHMAQVQKIETAVREKRDDNRKPNNANRNARRALFLRRAQEDLPHIPADFVKTTKAFKAATRIFRDGGSERGWQTLKPKIEKEWEDSSTAQNAVSPVPGLDGALDDDIIMTDDHKQPASLPTLTQPSVSGMGQRAVPGYPPRDFYGLASSSITDLGVAMNYRGNSSHGQHLGGMYSSSSSNRSTSHLTYLGGSFLPQPTFHNNPSNSVYGHLPNHYQHLMGGHGFHNHQNALHGNHHAPRPMSIPSLLADPPRMDPMGMRYSNGQSQSQFMG